ncbi:unnamed protein product [Urochloa humidicola]
MRPALLVSASESRRNQSGVVDVGADEGEDSGGGAGEAGGAGEPGAARVEEAAASSSDTTVGCCSVQIRQEQKEERKTCAIFNGKRSKSDDQGVTCPWILEFVLYLSQNAT